jgi:hypothetical protein
MSEQTSPKAPFAASGTGVSGEAANRLDEPPELVLPGDDPRLDALAAQLRAQSDDGDPFHVKSEKLRARRKREGEAAAQALSAQAPAAGKGVQTRWLVIAALGILAPVLALALGLFRSKTTDLVDSRPAQAAPVPVEMATARPAPSGTASPPPAAGPPPLKEEAPAAPPAVSVQPVPQNPLPAPEKAPKVPREAAPQAPQEAALPAPKPTAPPSPTNTAGFNEPGFNE